jgi:hypothetical protein
MSKYIIIQNRGLGDRLGAQISWYICQIIFAHYNSYYIEYNEEIYPDSIFTLSLKNYINEYNQNKNKGEYINFIDTYDWCKLNSKVVIEIKMDLINYFKNKMYKLKQILDNCANFKNYIIPFNLNETILIHLRLDDVDFTNRIDYDGSLSFNYYVNKLNNSDFDYSDESNHYLNNNITDKFNLYNAQAPISDYKIENIIKNIKNENKYKNYNIIIITSLKGDVTLPYPVIRSADPSVDLYYLTKANIVILSRSTFSISSLYFSEAKEIWIPKWGYIASIGLGTKYSDNKFNYFD